MVEQATHNRQVTGSNPVGAKFHRENEFLVKAQRNSAPYAQKSRLDILQRATGEKRQTYLFQNQSLQIVINARYVLL